MVGLASLNQERYGKDSAFDRDPAISQPVLDFDTLVSAADAMTIAQLKRACKMQDVQKALIDPNSESGVKFETIQAYRMGKYTLMPVYSTFIPDCFWGWRISSINGYMISERLFQKPTNALRALWVFAQLMDHLLTDSGELIEGLDRNEQQKQFYVLHGLYSN